MASDRVVVNAGGRLFETTTTTLLSSGSGYFTALLGPTGAALGSLSPTAEDGEESSSGANNPTSNDGLASVTAVTPHTRDRKRARSSQQQTDGPAAAANESTESVVAGPSMARVKEIFVDRNPDLFSDVLDFMRSARLPARARQDVARLEDLKAEALFFGSDGLDGACDEALQKLRAAIEDALKPEPQPTARCCGFVVPADETLSINVPAHKVLYIASATLAGRCQVRRYDLSDEQRKEKQEEEEETGEEDTTARTGCYINPCEQSDNGDFQLLAKLGANSRFISIAHVGINHFHAHMEMGINVDFRQDIRQCLAPESTDRHVRLHSSGSGDWHLACWIGDPSAIPQVNNNVGDRLRETKKRRLERSRNALTAAGTATAAASASAAMTTDMLMMTAMLAFVAMGVGGLRR